VDGGSPCYYWVCLLGVLVDEMITTNKQEEKEEDREKDGTKAKVTQPDTTSFPVLALFCPGKQEEKSTREREWRVPLVAAR
jgi:hypothetical protein